MGAHGYLSLHLEQCAPREGHSVKAQLKVIHPCAFSASLAVLVTVNTHGVETARGQAFPSNSVFLGFQP